MQLVFFVLKSIGSGSSFGLILALGIIPRVVLGPIAGNLADRANKKVLIVFSDILSGLIMFRLLLMFGLKGFNVNYVYTASFLLAVCNTFLDNTFSAALPCRVKYKNFTRVSSARQTIRPIVNIVAPLAGGLIISLLDGSKKGMNIFILY